MAERAEHQDKLVQLYCEITEGGTALDDDTVHAMWRVVAKLSREVLDDQAQAVSFWEKVLELVPDNEEAIDALEELYAELARWEDLLGILERKEDAATDDEDRIRLAFKRSELLVEHLDRLDDAAQSYRAVLDVNPVNIDAIRGLKRIHERKEAWPELAATLQRELDLVVEERPVILVELGDVHLNRLNDFESAIDFYSRLIDEYEDNIVAIDRLENLLGIEEHRARVARLLEPVYRRSESWDSLCEILEIRLEELTDPLDRVALLWELFELRRERLEDNQAAFDTVVRVFEASRLDERAWEELEALAEELGAWQQVAELYGAHKPADVDGEEVEFQLLRAFSAHPPESTG